jgi:hypothetical protein
MRPPSFDHCTKEIFTRFQTDEEISPVVATNVDNNKDTSDRFKLSISFTGDKIEHLCDLLVEKYFWKRLTSLKSVLEQLNCSEFNIDFFHDELDLHEFVQTDFDLPPCSPSQTHSDHDDGDKQDAKANFKLMLFDLVGELLLDLYSEMYEDEAGTAARSFENVFQRKIRTKKVHFKSLYKGPDCMEVAKKLVNEKVSDYLLNVEEKKCGGTPKKEYTLISSRSKWRQRKRLDPVDRMLDREMREQEYEWSNYDDEEYEAKLILSNTIFDMVMHDTIQCFQTNFIKKYT